MELRPHLDLARGAAAVRACASETAVRGGGGWAPPVSSFREAYAARGALPRHISTRVYASAQTHNHQNGLHVSLHEGRGRRE